MKSTSYSLKDLSVPHSRIPAEIRWPLIKTHLSNRSLNTDHVVRAYESKVPFSDILETTGLTKYNVYFILDHEGVPRQHKHKQRRDHTTSRPVPQEPGKFSKATRNVAGVTASTGTTGRVATVKVATITPPEKKRPFDWGYMFRLPLFRAGVVTAALSIVWAISEMT